MKTNYRCCALKENKAEGMERKQISGEVCLMYSEKTVYTVHRPLVRRRIYLKQLISNGSLLKMLIDYSGVPGQFGRCL